MESWRIDDLARKAGLTVDTVRYYQRERLLPAPRREGRHALYGPDHLERLERIRDLQARRFSLAAIRSLLETDRPGLVDAIFSTSAAAYSFDDLVERSGIDPGLAAALRAAGVLRDPTDFGREAYDNEDLDVFGAVGELHRAGLPPELVIELGRIYTAGVEAMQLEVLELFATHRDTLGAVERQAFAQRATGQAPALLPLVQRLVGYIHERTLQRLTLGAIDRGDGPPADDTPDDDTPAGD